MTTDSTTGQVGIEPLIPDYSEGNIRGLIPALLGPSGTNDLPDWMPSVVRGCAQVVVLVLDGLGWDQLNERPELAPTMSKMQGGAITSVVPTTTATALTSITTGLTPAEHGLIGYRMAVGGEVLNVLRWSVGGEDRRRSFPPADVQSTPAFLGHDVAVVSPCHLENSAFTEAHLGGCRAEGWRAASSIAPRVAELLAQGDRLVYAYYSGVDTIAHEQGFGAYYDAELATTDDLVRQVIDVLPAGAVLVVTADHGQVEVGDRIIVPPAELLNLLTLQSGEGRFRWLHAKPGAAAAVLEMALERFGSSTWVVSAEQVLDEGWMGRSMRPAVRSRLGDVALVPHEPIAFFDPDDSGPFELICRHGSLTSAEMRVPLLAAAG
jgi:predicted AlkP superfamily pyrophosphatase or phosphodiesterase